MKMKTRTKVLAALAVVLVIILAVILLPLRRVPIGNGETVLVRASARGGGASAGSDLRAELESHYGTGDEKTQLGQVPWDGQTAVASDAVSYDISYLGRSLAGGDYYQCTVTILRTVEGQDGAVLAQASQVLTYTGYDDGIRSSRVRASVLWDSVETAFPEGEEHFSALLGG